MEEYEKAKNNRDIANLSIDKQVDYKFYLLKYSEDVKGTQQINNGINSLTSLSSPMKVIEQIRDPRKLITCIIYILIFLLLLALGGYFIVYWFFMNFKSKTNIGEVHTFSPLLLNYNANPKVYYLIAYIPVLIGLVIIILICLFFYKSYLFEIERAYQILSHKGKGAAEIQSPSNTSSNQSRGEPQYQPRYQPTGSSQSPSNQPIGSAQSNPVPAVPVIPTVPAVPVVPTVPAVPVIPAVPVVPVNNRPFLTNSGNSSNNVNVAIEMGRSFLRNLRFRR
jgi:hypothetical protein